MTSKTEKKEIRVYGYRWVVLVVYILISIMMQVFWICYAPITGAAASELGVSDSAIGLLAIIFMYIFIPLALPASWLIDTWGFKKSVGLGAVLMAIFGVLRGLYTQDYTLTLVMTLGIAIAQPLLLNSQTKLVANWFRLEERATVMGIAGIFVLVGIAGGQIVTPLLLQASSLHNTMMIYGIAGAVSALLFLLLGRDHPPTPAGHEEKALMLDGLRHILRLRDVYLLAFLIFVIYAIFNGIATWVEVMVRPRGLDLDQAGLIGGLLIIGGMVGFIIFSVASDSMRKRRPVLIMGALASAPFLVLLAYVNGFTALAVVSFLLGLCVMGGIPVALQYATEICYPAPEGTSQGVFNIAGQIAVVGVSAMGWSNDVYGSFAPSLIVFAAAMALAAVFVWIMAESRLMQASQPA
jgi:MFS family permease